MTFTTLDPADQAALALRHGDLEEAVAQIEAADLVDPVTIAARERVLSFCDDHADALHRSCLAGHLTGSALIVDAAATRTLLLHHAKLDRWLQPGGHADGDGNLAAVARREAEEETGIVGLRIVTPAIDIDVHTIPERGDEPEHLHLDVRFLVVAPPGATVEHNHESLDARWATLADSAVASSPELARAAGRALAVAASLGP